MHCDVNQEESVSHIWDCVNLIGVDRIDHGINSLEDAALCNTLKERNLALTVCPISNSFVTDGPGTDAIGKMLELGMRVTVNSDDPAYFGGYIEENFVLVEKSLALGPHGLAALSKNAIEAAWLPRTVRDKFIGQVDAHLAHGA